MAVSFAPGLNRIGQQGLRAALALVRRLDDPRARSVVTPPVRHPLQPAAIRVERSSSGYGGETSAQTAVTMWFGEGPALPSAGGGAVRRGAMRVGVTVLGAAMLAALTAVVAQQDARLGAKRVRRIVAAEAPSIPAESGRKAPVGKAAAF